MKNTKINLISSVAIVVGLAVSPAGHALDSADASKALAGSSALELPGKAADLVAKASSADKQSVAVAAVKAAVALNPSATVAIVSAMVRETPAAAPVIAITATTMQHKRMGLIVKAAASAAPSEAAKIVAAMLKEFPREYGIIALAAAQGSPKSGLEILAVVGNSNPSLQPYIQAATAKIASTDGEMPVQAILNQSYDQALAFGAISPAGQSKDITLAQTPTTGNSLPIFSPVLDGPTLVPPFSTNIQNTNVITTNSSTVVTQTTGSRPYGSP